MLRWRQTLSGPAGLGSGSTSGSWMPLPMDRLLMGHWTLPERGCFVGGDAFKVGKYAGEAVCRVSTPAAATITVMGRGALVLGSFSSSPNSTPTPQGRRMICSAEAKRTQ
ncbi:hypothetical protein AB0M68_14850 [Streptomyces sp. NPDC051453]|uniref:hypothetical protein n=1 Tax=Streptomyces sp. NPDC051453 TaxID=3154941 RepID=UPI00342D5D41